MRHFLLWIADSIYKVLGQYVRECRYKEARELLIKAKEAMRSPVSMPPEFWENLNNKLRKFDDDDWRRSPNSWRNALIWLRKRKTQTKKTFRFNNIISDYEIQRIVNESEEVR